MKKMITILGIFTITLISLGAVANDYSADRVKVDMTRTPSANTVGVQNTTTLSDHNTRMDNNSKLIIDIDKKVKGLLDSATNPNSCLYIDSFNCTKRNLSHRYKIKSWKKTGTHYWHVPAGITEVYVSVIGGQGGQGGYGGVVGDSGLVSIQY